MGDNGLAVGQHGLMGKQNLYEHSWRVPLVAILDLAGVPIPGTVDARSLAPVLKDPRRKHRQTVYGAYRMFQRAIRDDRYKLIRYTVNGETRVQVFDLREDPLEMRPLPARKDLLAQLDAEMRALGDPLAPV